MTKTMKINELISELKGYDGELTVKVWSNGADKAYPISHVGQGYTDGVLDTHVSIVIDDDRNLVDLSKIWHPATEIPTKEALILYRTSLGRYDVIFHFGNKEGIWKVFVKDYGVAEWAYVPKGGKR